MKPLFVLLAITCMAAVSCKKSQESAQPPIVSNEMVEVRLKLTGDITTTESNLPNGRRVNDGATGAKTFRDSTLYAVIVRRPNDVWTPLYNGLFNNTESIAISVPVGGEYSVSITAYKKGSSLGLFNTWVSGLQHFVSPINFTLRNRMDTVTTYPYLGDSLYYLRIINPLDTTTALPEVYYSEIDAYHGKTTFTATSVPAPFSINLKRMSFGIKLSADNFTTGKLIADFPQNFSYPEYLSMLPLSVTPANIAGKFQINSAQEFIFRNNDYADSTYPVNVKVTWQKPDGSLVPVGQKTISFKRNVLTNLHVTIPNSGRTGVQPVITETEFTNTETVTF